MTNNENTQLKSLVWGAIIGATVATLLNKDSRKKVKETIKSTLDESERKFDKIESATKDQMKDAKRVMNNAKQKARSKIAQKLDETKEKLEK